jgi:hypothetical protein
MPENEPLTEDEAYEIALNDHPDLREQLDNDTLPDELVDDDGNVWSPRSHLAIHTVIERQIANDEPRGIAQIARRLAESGVDHHEIRHLMGVPLTEQIWNVTHEGVEFDERQYMRDQEAIAEEHS